MPSVPSPTFRRNAFAWLTLIVLGLAGLYWWWQIGRPVDLPDAPSSRIACVSYAPFRDNDETPNDPHAFISPQRIDADLKALSQRFDCVRTYSQGQGLSAVPEIANHYHMKVLLGIWIGGNSLTNEQQIKLGIATAQKYPQVIRGVIVGSEALLRGDASSPVLAGYLKRVKAVVPEPVTYADVWQFWLRHPELALSVDFITIHILPYWEDDAVPPNHAVQHVADVYAMVRKTFPGKQVMIGETGWPSAGRPRQAVTATLVNEARYVREFLRYATTVDMPYNMIETFDQPWKRKQEGTVGGYWGIFDVHARPKFPMTGPVTEEPHWWAGWAAAAAGLLVFLLAGCWRRCWQGWCGGVLLALYGIGAGCALAWQSRQMWFACSNLFEWAVSITACVVGLLTALQLARWTVTRSTGAAQLPRPSDWLRFGWLFVLAYYGLLLVFDGRYRDLPLGLFSLPCIGYALVALLSDPGEMRTPMIEECFLAVSLPITGVVVVLEESGLSLEAWLWLAINVAIAVPTLIGWRQARQHLRLNPQQA